MKPSLEHVALELQKRSTVVFRLEDYLFPEQMAFVSDPSRFKMAVTTRRSGKTVSCAADLMFTAANTYESNCLYITLSRSNAKRIVWPELKKINRKFKLGFEFNESELKATSPTGSVIYCSGASDRSEIEKFRGQAFVKVYVDEAQSFPAYIEDLIDSILSPALMDYLGSLCLIGTPGPIPTGFFYECAHGSEERKAWASHFWTFWNNPHIKDHQKAFDDELGRRGVASDNPSIQREWFGRWVLDSDALVYRYDERINHYEELPKIKWNYILGVDLGFNDADALAVLAWSESSPTTFLVEEVITRHQGITELVGQIEALRTKYDISKVVIDQGGLGKKIAEELSKRYKIGVVAAEKQRKAEFIELFNDALRTGQLKAKKDSRFAQDCMKVEWDLDKSRPDKKVVSNRFHSDICDALLYIWRESYSFAHVPAKVGPKPGTVAWNEQESERMFNEEMDRLLKEKADNEGLWPDFDPKEP